MSLVPHILLALLLPAATAAPVDVWADGVSQEQGWRDYNKSFDGSDNDLCWAITATNIIDWWQNRHPDVVPATTPKGEEIMRTFVQSFSNAGSDPDEGLAWWFTGEYHPGRPECAARKESATGAYLRNALPDDRPFRQHTLKALRGPTVTAERAATALIEGAEAGAAFWIGVSYTSPAGRAAMHSLNVWGVRVDTAANGSRHLCGIWIADSDDRKTGLTYVPVKADDGMLVFHCPDHPIYSRMPRIVIDTISSLR